MKFDKLLSTKLDETGPYVPVEDWNDITLQIASVDAGAPFVGSIVIEGTTDSDPSTKRWSEVASSNSSAMLPLIGMSLFGIRARSTFMTGGEVIVTVAGK